MDTERVHNTSVSSEGKGKEFRMNSNCETASLFLCVCVGVRVCLRFGYTLEVLRRSVLDWVEEGYVIVQFSIGFG